MRGFFYTRQGASVQQRNPAVKTQGFNPSDEMMSIYDPGIGRIQGTQACYIRLDGGKLFPGE